MPLSEGDRAIIREIAFEVAKTIERSIAKSIETSLRLHGAECPANRGWKTWALVGAMATGLCAIVVGVLTLLKP